MIKKIKLENFGIFKKAEFDFSDVTVFYGKNESGKTTIFDAIFKAITDVKKNIGSGKHFERYGDLKNSLIQIEPDVKKIHPNVFLNIFAIRSGEITLDFTEKGLIEEVTERILSTNVRFGSLLENVRQIANTSDSRNKLNREKKNFENSISELEKKISELKERIKNYEKTEKEIREYEKLVEEKNKNLSELKNSFDEMENATKQLQKSRELKMLIEAYETVENFLKKKEEVEKITVDSSGLEEIKSKREEAEKLKLEREILGGFIKEKESEIEKFEKEKIETEQKSIKIEAILPYFNNLLLYRIMMIISGALGILCFSFSFIFLEKIYLLVIALAAGLTFVTLSIALYIFSRKIKNSIKEKIVGLVERKVRNLPLVLKNEKEKLKLRLEDIEERIRQTKMDKEKKNNELEKLEERYNSLKKTIENFLVKNESRDFDEIIKKNERFKILSKELTLMESKIKNFFSQYRITDIEKLETSLRRKIKDLEDEGISVIDYNEAEYNRIMREKNEVEKRIRIISDEVNGIERILSEKRGFLSNLSETIFELKEAEKSLYEKKSELTEIEKKQSAYSKIYDILQLIDRDTLYKFRHISDEIAKEFGDFFPQLKNISFNSLEKMDLIIEDGYGEKRKFDFLSKGTQDLFLLAFRLILAKKLGIFDRNGFLIFDEAFLSLDYDRMAKTLGLLYRFYNDTGWQFIFLTKDEELKNLLEKRFKKAIKIHNLGSINKINFQ